MLRGLVILLCFVSLILADNPLDILKDEFTIIRPFTVLENNATFYCKVTVLEFFGHPAVILIGQSSESHQVTEVRRAPLIHFQKIFSKKGFYRSKLA